jgi:DNA-directed RNA polymerase subunit RPC12/RpoP
MTETASDDRPIVCLDCDTEVTLSESEQGTLVLRCDCDDRRRHTKVSRVLPEGWA